MENRNLCCHCSSNSAIDSHIIPKFAGRKIKSYFNNGYFRGSTSENPASLRTQDILTQKLFCKPCDTAFGVIENKFKQNIYDAFWNEKKVVLDKQSILDFSILLNYKILCSNPRFIEEPPSILRKRMAILRQHWGGYLAHKNGTTPPSCNHHVIFPTAENIKALSSRKPERLVSLLGSTRFSIGIIGDSYYIFCIFTGFIFIVELYKNPVSNLRGTLVHPKFDLSNSQVVLDSSITDLLDESDELLAQSKSIITPKQSESIHQMTEDDILNSEFYKDIKEIFK